VPLHRSKSAEPPRKMSEATTQLGCEGLTACPQVMPIFNACVTDPAGGVVDFEQEIITELAANIQCKGVRLAKYSGPDAKQEQGDLGCAAETSLDDNHRFRAWWKQTAWSLQRDGMFTKGTGTAKETAASVCPIVTEQGAKQVSQ